MHCDAPNSLIQTLLYTYDINEIFSWSGVFPSPTCYHPELSYILHLGWCASSDTGTIDYLQIDLKDSFIIESIITWGRTGRFNQYITSYNLTYSLDNIVSTSQGITNPFLGILIILIPQ